MRGEESSLKGLIMLELLIGIAVAVALSPVLPLVRLGHLKDRPELSE